MNLSPKDIFARLLKRPIAFHRVFAEITGSATTGLFLSQAFYWSQHTSDPDGWFYKTQAEWEEETVLSRREQETARKRLRHLGILEEELRDLPAKLYYRINMDALQASVAENASPVWRKTPNLDGGKRQTFLTETTYRDKKQENPPFPPSGTDVPSVCSPGAYVAETALQPYEYRGKVEPLPVDTLDMPSSRKPAYPPGFLAFWEAYPKKRRVGKPKCLALWTKRGLEHRQGAVLAELQRMKNTADWQQGFMPASTTWLNQGRYDDGDAPAFTSHAEGLFTHVRQHRDPNADPLLAALYQRNQTHKLSTPSPHEEPQHV